MKECPYCKQTDIPDDAKTCYHCGKTLIYTTEQKMLAVGAFLFVLGIVISLVSCGVASLFGL